MLLAKNERILEDSAFPRFHEISNFEDQLYIAIVRWPRQQWRREDCYVFDTCGLTTRSIIISPKTKQVS